MLSKINLISTVILTVAACLTFGFWIFAVGYLIVHRHEAAAEPGEWILHNATISIFGLAILLNLRRTRASSSDLR